MLTHEMAEDIVRETMKILGRNINIMDENGIILSSGDPERVNHFHEAAGEAAAQRKPVVISEKDSGNWRGTQPGINLPIQFQGNVIGVVGISGVPEEVNDFGTLVATMTELMIQQKYLLNQVEWRQHTQAFLLEEILREGPPFESIEQKLQLLEIKLAPPYELFVFDLHEPRGHVTPREIYHEVEHLLKGHGVIYNLADMNTLTVLFSGKRHEQSCFKLQKRLAEYYGKVRVGHGREVNGLDQIYGSFLETRKALKISKAPVVSPKDFEARIKWLQVDEEDRTSFAGRILQGLPQDLEESLVVFFETDLNLSQAAKTLYLHRNTLVYRLDKVKEWTGYDPRNFLDALTLQLAVWSKKVR